MARGLSGARRRCRGIDTIDVSAAGRDPVAPDDGRLRPPYAIQTLLDELTLEPVVIRDGEPVRVAPLSPAGSSTSAIRSVPPRRSTRCTRSWRRSARASAAGTRASGSRSRRRCWSGSSGSSERPPRRSPDAAPRGGVAVERNGFGPPRDVRADDGRSSPRGRSATPFRHGRLRRVDGGPFGSGRPAARAWVARARPAPTRPSGASTPRRCSASSRRAAARSASRLSAALCAWSRSHSTVCAIPSRSSICASQPSSRRAFSTDGQRRCTSTSKLGRCSSSSSAGIVAARLPDQRGDLRDRQLLARRRC